MEGEVIRLTGPYSNWLNILSVLALASWLWLIILGFQKHIGWGFANFLIPFACVLFGLLNLDKAKIPVAIYIASIALMISLIFQISSDLEILTESLTYQDEYGGGDGASGGQLRKFE